MKFYSFFIGAIVASFSAVNTSAVAQDSKSLTPNLRHDRHMHHHNARHRVLQPTTDRFYTTRNSEVPLPLPNEDDAFVFAIFGDRAGGPADGVNVLADAVRDVNLLEPDLVMTVGDLINGYNQTPKWMEQMKEFRTIMGELLCPWFPVAGNHDVYWRPLNDPAMPKTQHDANYEMHFGPLWYSFQHKNCNFIVLYSDESDPRTGEKNFSDPSIQKISDQQYEFLTEALARGKDCDHQFLFLHHPRWLSERYGNDWNQRVHPLLKKTSNVSAVFAGHIHYMRYDPQDDIEYVALATVGGNQTARVPEAGYLHQYHLITVRPEQVAMTSYPVGEAMNVREITSELQQQLTALAEQTPELSGDIAITESGPQGTILEATVHNPADRPVEFTLTPESGDRNWFFAPNHSHGRILPGASETVRFEIDYHRADFDNNFQSLEFVLTQDYLARTTRYTVPVTRRPVRFKLDLPVPDSNDIPNQALALDGRNDAVGIPSDQFRLKQGPFTAEAWFKARSFSERVALLAKTQTSEFSIFLNNGRPSASVFLDGKYRTVHSDQAVPTEQWTHVAVVCDGSSIVLFVNGQEVARTKTNPNWQRKTNSLPLYVGADPDGDGQPVSFFHGFVDEVRITKGAVYSAPFTPNRRLRATDDTVLLYNFDRSVGPIQLDSGPQKIHSQSRGGAGLTSLAN